jgi:hypothetical protein
MPHQGAPPCLPDCFQTPPEMIVVSKSSAEAMRGVRTDRYTPARRPTSAAHHDTPKNANARPISVHTEEVNRSRSGNLGPPAGLAPGWPRAGHESGGSPRARVSRRPILRRANTPRVPLACIKDGQPRSTADTCDRPDHRSRPLTAPWAQLSRPGLTCDYRRRAAGESITMS